ncbi:acyltransferase-domain-containing protein [Rhodocollybia butyracea]|uniref:Tafazzin family protein n=1 Tax=Rhodocollybia butyracea TaxID=206335 RepID=A0A9P5Q814_9AGAR|nr:acyltransferase-domain-containing protein [Rhodocollybia butyracea]
MSLRSAATVSIIGLTCKAFLNSGLCRISVNGLHNLVQALEDDQRQHGRGIVTVSNHISTLDDPVTWGILPAKYYARSSRFTRWTLGASDIMFTNPAFSTFFRYGQVLETFRGRGIYQVAVDNAIEKLNRGDWIHLFGEGKVNQPDTYLKDETGMAILPRFKWGVGRILSSTSKPPTIIPMWITGFDKLMPEGRAFPFKYCPRIGARLSVTFGEPLPLNIHSIRDRIIDEKHPHQTDIEVDARIRTDITATVHEAVLQLGRQVSGPSLKDSTT